MNGARSALIVASDIYRDPSMRQLRAPAMDAQALASVLSDPDIGNFDVNILLNRPAHEVNLAVEEFFADRHPDDLLLLHLSCHGVKDESGELYFAMENSLLRRLGATGVSAEFVNRQMSRSRSRRIVLLLDCCYAGAFERGMIARAGSGVGIESQFGGRGRAVITASSAMEYAFEGDVLTDSSDPRPSVFTDALVTGLATGDADRDQDGRVGLDELYDYVYDKVRAATPNQTPGKWMFGVEGDLIIARRSRPITTPAPLPAELREAIESPFATVRVAAVQELARLISGQHAGLALGARHSLERLLDDDSRRAAAAAAEVLDDDKSPTMDEGTPTPAGQTINETDTVAEPEPAPQAATMKPPGDSRTVPQTETRNLDVTHQVAGFLATLGAALAVGSLFPYFVQDYSLSGSSATTAETWWRAALAFAAGLCLLVPRTRMLLGRGLTLAVGALALPGPAYDITIGHDYPPVGPGLWLDTISNLSLIAAGGLVAAGLRHSAAIRIKWRPVGPVPLLISLLGVAGAWALLTDVVNASTLPGRGQAYRADQDLAPLIITAAMVLIVPTMAAITIPRLFGAILLSGWVAAAGSLAPYYTGFQSTFTLTLLGLLVLTPLLTRSSPRLDKSFL